MRVVTTIFLALLAPAFLLSCAGSQPVPGGGAELSPAVELPAPGSIAPREVSAMLSARSGGDFETAGVEPLNVSAVGAQGRFTPYYADPPNKDSFIPAYALYTFNLGSLSGPQTLTTVWQVPIMAEELWVGLGDRVDDAWDWFMVYPEGDLAVDVDEIGTYMDETDRVVAVVLALGDATCNLSHLYFLENPPVITAISPQSGSSGAEVEFWTQVAGLGPFNYAWDFGGGATPNVSAEADPLVTLGDPGTYGCSLTVANFFGDDTFLFGLEVLEDYQPGTGELSAQFETDTGTVADPVRVVVASGGFPHPFQYMNGVAVTVEEGAEYVDLSFNVGAPGGAQKDPDGSLWPTVDPLTFLVPQDNMYTEAPVDGDPGLIYIAFSVIPVDGTDTTTGGELFNFEMQFSAAGTYHLGFLEFQTVKRTYYSDGASNEYYWNTISNGNGVNTIVISE